MVPRLRAGLPGLRSVHVTAAIHPLHKPPALDVVKVTRPVSAANIKTRVHGNTCPRVRTDFDTCGRVAQVGRQQFSRHGLMTAEHLHHDAPVLHEEHPGPEDVIPVLPEVIERHPSILEVLVCLAPWLEVVKVLGAEVHVDVNVPRDEVAEFDRSECRAGQQLVVKLHVRGQSLDSVQNVTERLHAAPGHEESRGLAPQVTPQSNVLTLKGVVVCVTEICLNTLKLMLSSQGLPLSFWHTHNLVAYRAPGIRTVKMFQSKQQQYLVRNIMSGQASIGLRVVRAVSSVASDRGESGSRESVLSMRGPPVWSHTMQSLYW